MSYEIYKTLHFLGIAMLMLSLGGFAGLALSGQSPTEASRKLMLSTHGTSLLIILIAGFGMHAKAGIGGFPLWLIIKLVVWILFGGLTVMFRKNPASAKSLWWIMPLLVAFAGWLALAKPF